MEPIRTTCAYCGVGCGISATVTGERSVDIAGDVSHPANYGKLCSKGTHLGETVGLDGRLLYPEIAGQRVAWDHALDAVAGRMRDCIHEHGPDSVALYVSGQLLTEDYYVANKLAKGFIGTGNIDTNSRLCMASAVAAHNRAFGEDVVPVNYDDLDETDLVLLVGSNTAWCHPVIWQRIEQARAERGTKIVVIDPRRTETAEQADLHIAVPPDGDVALFNALLAEMMQRGELDEAYIADHCVKPEGFWEGLDNTLHGLSASDFNALAGLVASHPRMITLFSQGANQSVGGTDKGNAIINLHLATGRIARTGAGPFSITGQPNAMGGREVGGLANMLACHLGFSDSELADVATFWGAPNMCSGPGHKAVDMFRAVHDGRIKFIWVMATNPAVSMPDAGFVREALERCPTVVVSDVMADTDTGRLADIRLPALGWGEKDGTVTNSERRVSRQRALFSPPGETRADWRIICDVATRLGYGDAFGFTGPSAIFREYAAMTALASKYGKLLDLSEHQTLSDNEYEAMEPFRWGGERPFAEGFSTSHRKAQLVPVAIPKICTDLEFPLRLNTGRYRDQWHTMTRTGLSPKLSLHRREPLLEVHPDDAARDGLEQGGLAEIATPFGSGIFRVEVTEGQRAGEIFAPIHWTDAMGSLGRAGRLAKDATDPVSGQPGFKDTPARLAPVEPAWRAFLVQQDIIDPKVPYWSRSRIEGGWLTELAGSADKNGAIDVDALLPAGHRSEVSDLARGMRRVSVADDAGTLIAALYVTRFGELPARDWISAQLGQADSAAGERLAGRPSTPLPEKGAIVCVCHGVGENEIFAACDTGATSVEAIGACTAAGTNCGSCRPAIAQMLASLELELEEAAQ
ncbi:nitrate reductase [Altererythrobacter sp. RZ02]|uniref:Nitrate reductase n=1 Tax=Pontixanthobacter rizhaonensis TaxID=2730337 RepID=A0A848QPM0_9SPHN|nr:nitrate reductase [Pontixanthobacter rizhaonensis]NMW32547.1 nitrate reductase [Pontixanthobacter rizhaonensis]